MFGNQEQCPRCGSVANTADVIWDAIGPVVTAIAESDLSISALARLQSVADAAVSGRIPVEEAVDKIGEVSKSLSERIREEARKSPIGAMALIVSTAGVLLDHAGQLPVEELMHAVAKLIEQAF